MARTFDVKVILSDTNDKQIKAVVTLTIEDRQQFFFRQTASVSLKLLGVAGPAGWQAGLASI